MPPSGNVAVLPDLRMANMALPSEASNFSMRPTTLLNPHLSFQSMPEYNSKIREFEEELKKTKYNKKTQHHVGLVKAKIAALRDKEQSRAAGKGKTYSYDVRKTGDASAVILGYPSVGKSTLLNKLTNQESKTAAYAFTTLTVIPGLLEHKGAKIQILDVPGIVKGAAAGTGRGKEVLAVMRSANLVIILIDVNSQDHLNVLIREIFESGIRINQKRPDVKIKKTARGGIRIGKTVKKLTLTDATIQGIMKEMGIMNAEVVIREDISDDQLIDCIEDNRIYLPAITVVNKIDMVDPEKAKAVARDVKADILVSAEKGINIEQLKEAIFRKLNFIRMYMKEPGKKPDMEEPLIMTHGCTIRDVCRKLHREFESKFKFARLWGPTAKFPGQKILRLDTGLKDTDVLEIHLI